MFLHATFEVTLVSAVCYFLCLEGHATDTERSLRTFQVINVHAISASPGHRALTVVAVCVTIYVFRQTYNDDASMTVSAVHAQARRRSLAKWAALA